MFKSALNITGKFNSESMSVLAINLASAIRLNLLSNVFRKLLCKLLVKLFLIRW